MSDTDDKIVDINGIRLKKIHSSTIRMEPPYMTPQMMSERGDGVQWREFNQVFYDTLREMAPHIPFKLVVEVEDGLCHWRTYLTLPVKGRNGPEILVNDQFTSHEFREPCNNNPQAAQFLVEDQTFPRLELAYEAWKADDDVQKVLDEDNERRKNLHHLRQIQYENVVIQPEIDDETTENLTKITKNTAKKD